MRGQAKSSRPLYWQVADDIQSHIERGIWCAGTKLPSERTLCEQYQVSQITIRRSLRELAHQGLVYSRHGVGWFVAETPHTWERAKDEGGSEPDVTIILPALDGICGPLVQHLIVGLSAESVPVRLFFSEGNSLRQSAAIELWQRRVAQQADEPHVLLLAACGDPRRVADELTRLGQQLAQPVGLLLYPIENVDLPCVFLDETLCLQKITQYLLRLGHRRVAYLGEEPAHVVRRSRYWGFALSLWEEGLDLPLDWVFSTPLWSDRAHGRYTEQGRRFREVFNRPYRPSALVCSSDLHAAEALHLLTALGLQCPRDVAVVGVGDDPLADFLPTPLTSLHYHMDELMRAALRMTLDLLAGRRATGVAVSGDLVIRASCGARYRASGDASPGY
ncbi:MAG: GntR family transcriptional regulator [Chloroflexi bacterium]|nr:GntR family transcriptional regulator [Chloroflexota bacterium]